MAINTNFTKEAAPGSLGKSLVGLSSNLINGWLAYALLAGGAAGLAGGAAASYIKSKDPKLMSLKRKKEFYDRKVEEMDNENWLSDLMDTKRKLETARMSDEERDDLEKKYLKLLER